MYNKIRVLTVGLMLTGMISHAQKTNVSANITGLDAPEVEISYYVGDSIKVDTVKVTSGTFHWVADMPEPQQVNLIFPERVDNFFAENGNIRITGKMGALHVTGSKSQKEYESYLKSLSDIDAKESVLYNQWGKGTKEQQNELEAKLDKLRKEERERGNEYISAHPKSPVSIYLITNRGAIGDYSDVKAIYDKLDPSAQQTDGGKRIAERLAVLKRSAIGAPMLDFTQQSSEGEEITFDQFKGKYVLVDFWASWCGPCRAENPNVLKAYNKYKGKNFTLVGISLDDNEARWKKAIKDDNMPWTQVSDLKGWNNEIATYYGIRAIPCTYLVNPEGKIIATYLRGEELNKKLAELLD